MNWILLIIAGLFEVGFATCLGKAKESTGNTSLLWYGGFLVCLSISMILLVKATKELPIGTAYAVWTGIGAVGSVLVGIIVFKEPATFWRVFFISTLTGNKKDVSDARLSWYIIRFPFITIRVMLAIHWQALKLWLKKIPYHKKSANADLQRDIINVRNNH